MAQATYGLGGHGLLITPAPTCRALVTDDDELVLAIGEHEVARFTPGDAPATGAVEWLTADTGRFGAGGPVVSLVEGTRFEDVVLRVDVGLGEGPWVALCRGFMVDLPAGVVLLPPTSGDDDIELHLQGGRDEFIRFQRAGRPADTIRFQPAPYQQLVRHDVVTVNEGDGATRSINFMEVSYDHEGAPWRQIMIAAPYDAQRTIVVSAQARHERADALFRAAGQVAATLGPLG